MNTKTAFIAIVGCPNVGKSSLINCIQSHRQMETGNISRKIERGKHTTRHSELIYVGEDTYILDTPGFSSLGLFDLEKEDLAQYYPEFAEHEGCCRFTPCMHDREPGCSVTAAVDAGEIDAGRVERYRLLLADVRGTWKQRYN